MPRNIVYEVLPGGNYAEENKSLASRGFMSVGDDKLLEDVLMNKESYRRAGTRVN